MKPTPGILKLMRLRKRNRQRELEEKCYQYFMSEIDKIKSRKQLNDLFDYGEATYEN